MIATIGAFLGFKPKKKDSVVDRLEARMAASGRKKVLMVDDDQMLQDLLQIVGQGRPVDVTSALTATQAKAMIGAEDFDLIILDVGILNGDGISLFQWLHDNYPTRNVIFLTGGLLDRVIPQIRAISSSALIYPKPTTDSLVFLADLLRFAWAKPVACG